MVDIHIEYFEGILEENETIEITQLCRKENTEIEFHKKSPFLMNAALEQLVGDVVLHLPPAEIVPFALTSLIPAICTIVNKIHEFGKNKSFKKVTSNNCENKELNIIIENGNTKILFSDNVLINDMDKYLEMAIEAAVEYQQMDKAGIIISGNNKELHVESLEKYAYRIIQQKQQLQQNDIIDYQKLEETFRRALTKVEHDKEEKRNELLEQKEKESQETEKNNKVRSFFMRLCNWVMYAIVYTIAAYCFYIMFKVETNNNAELFVKIILMVIFVVIAIFMFLSQFESFKDSYKEVREHFNSNIGFAALIIAIIALVKGVG